MKVKILSNFSEIKYWFNTDVSAKKCNKFVFTGNRVYLFRKKLLDRKCIQMIFVIYLIRWRTYSNTLYKHVNWNMHYMSHLFARSNIIMKLITAIFIYELYIFTHIYVYSPNMHLMLSTNYRRAAYITNIRGYLRHTV